jgi:hypothetical protein
MDRNHLMKELTEMKKIGMKVPHNAFALVIQATDAELESYADMSVSECADMFISMARC